MERSISYQPAHTHRGLVRIVIETELCVLEIFQDIIEMPAVSDGDIETGDNGRVDRQFCVGSKHKRGFFPAIKIPLGL